MRCSGVNLPERNNVCCGRSDKQNIDDRTTMNGVIGRCITLYNNSNNNLGGKFVHKRFHVRYDIHEIIIVYKNVVQIYYRMKRRWVATGQANSTVAGVISDRHYTIMFKMKAQKIKRSRDTDDDIGFG